MVRNIYIYVKKILVNNCLKYGMKLSDHSNLIIKEENNIISKKGIHAYFTPRDCNLYDNDDYKILRISTLDDTLRIFAFNNDKITKLDTNITNNIGNDNNNLKKEIIRINSLNNNLSTENNTNLINLKDYTLGDFNYPELLISSSIMPENICVYNKILDVPLLFTTSSELYNQKKEEIFVQENLNNVTYNEIIKR